MPIIHLNFYDVVSKRDFSMNVMTKDYIWSSYKTMKIRMGTLRCDYTLLYDGEVLNRHNKWNDYGVTNNSTIILLEQCRQSRFTDSSSFNFRSRASIAPLLTTMSADGFSRGRRLPAIPPMSDLPPPPPPPRQDRLAYRPPRSRVPPGIIGQAVFRGLPATNTNNSLQDFSDIQTILRSVIQNEEAEENGDGENGADENSENNIAVTGRALPITSFEPLPPPSNHSEDLMNGATEDTVERVEEIEDISGNLSSVLESVDGAPDEDDIDQTEATFPPNLTLLIRVNVPPESSESGVNAEENGNPPEDLPDSSENRPYPLDEPEASHVPSDPVMVVEFYRSVYSNQVAQLLGMGYTNETLILEALMLNHGDITEAIDWMA